MALYYVSWQRGSNHRLGSQRVRVGSPTVIIRGAFVELVSHEHNFYITELSLRRLSAAFATLSEYFRMIALLIELAQ
jgi:hypothetical protein